MTPMPTALDNEKWLADARSSASARAAELPLPRMSYGLGIFMTPDDVGIAGLPATADACDVGVSVESRGGDVTVLDFAQALVDEQLALLVRTRLSPVMFGDVFDAWRAGTLLDTRR